MALKIYPYKIGSESATALADLLNVLKVKPDGNYIPKVYDKVINWGSGRNPNWATTAANRGVTILNKPNAVNIASDKLAALRALKTAGITVPEYTTDMTIARTWLRSGATVVERHELRGHSGVGIRIVNLNDDEMPSDLQLAPLYTKFIPKTAEFRVHCFRGEVIDLIEKKRLPTERRPENFNKYISSVNLGWVFSRTDIRDIPEVRQLALRAVAALNLDFGAVDIVYENGIPYVLEVNTAPSLKNVTLVKYSNAFRRFMGQPDLPTTVTANLLEPQPVRPVAAVTAQADNTMHEMVNLRIDRATALKLRALLANI